MKKYIWDNRRIGGFQFKGILYIGKTVFDTTGHVFSKEEIHCIVLLTMNMQMK